MSFRADTLTHTPLPKQLTNTGSNSLCDHGPYRDLQGPSRTFKELKEPSRTFKDLQGPTRTFKDFQGP